MVSLPSPDARFELSRPPRLLGVNEKDKRVLEIGKVIEIRRDRAKVSLPRKSDCASCGRCGLGRGGADMVLEAENGLGAVAGDRVEVEIPERELLAAALLLFGTPVLGLLAGAGAGYLLFSSWGGDPDAGAGIFGLLTMAGVFIMLRLRERRLMKKDGGGIRIVKILAPG